MWRNPVLAYAVSVIIDGFSRDESDALGGEHYKVKEMMLWEVSILSLSFCCANSKIAWS